MPSHGDPKVCVADAGPQRELQRRYVPEPVEFDVRLEPRQLARAGFYGQHQPIVSNPSRRIQRVEPLVRAGVEHHHSGLEDAPKKHELVRLEGTQDVEAQTEIVVEEYPDPESFVPAKYDRDVGRIVAVMGPDIASQQREVRLVVGWPTKLPIRVEGEPAATGEAGRNEANHTVRRSFQKGCAQPRRERRGTHSSASLKLRTSAIDRKESIQMMQLLCAILNGRSMRSPQPAVRGRATRETAHGTGALNVM